MELKLLLDGKEKVFKSSKITARLYRKTIQLHADWNEGTFMPAGYGVDDIDGAIEYICDVFGNQFTPDEFLDGCMLDDAIDFLKIINDCMDSVLFNDGKVEKNEKKA